MGRRKAAVLDAGVELDRALQAVAHSTPAEVTLPEGWRWEQDRTAVVNLKAIVLIEPPKDYGLTQGTSAATRWGAVWYEQVTKAWIAKAGEWSDAGLTFHKTEAAAKAACVVAALAKKLEKHLLRTQDSEHGPTRD